MYTLYQLFQVKAKLEFLIILEAGWELAGTINKFFTSSIYYNVHVN